MVNDVHLVDFATQFELDLVEWPSGILLEKVHMDENRHLQGAGFIIGQDPNRGLGPLGGLGRSVKSWETNLGRANPYPVRLQDSLQPNIEIG